MNIGKCENLKCFACKGAHCMILTQPIMDKPCPFFKTDEQLDEGRDHAYERLMTKGRVDLIRKYTANTRDYMLTRITWL